MTYSRREFYGPAVFPGTGSSQTYEAHEVKARHVFVLGLNVNQPSILLPFGQKQHTGVGRYLFGRKGVPFFFYNIATSGVKTVLVKYRRAGGATTTLVTLQHNTMATVWLAADTSLSGSWKFKVKSLL